MKRYANALIVTICFLLSHSSLVFAAQFFERYGLAIDGYDPVAYFMEQKPVKGSPEFRVEFEGTTFQFVSAVHREAFLADPSVYGVTEVRLNGWADIVCSDTQAPYCSNINLAFAGWDDEAMSDAA